MIHVNIGGTGEQARDAALEELRPLLAGPDGPDAALASVLMDTVGRLFDVLVDDADRVSLTLRAEAGQYGHVSLVMTVAPKPVAQAAAGDRPADQPPAEGGTMATRRGSAGGTNGGKGSSGAKGGGAKGGAGGGARKTGGTTTEGATDKSGTTQGGTSGTAGGTTGGTTSTPGGGTPG